MVCKIILVYGLWLNPCHIPELQPKDDKTCYVFVQSGSAYGRNSWHTVQESCATVANEINRQIIEDRD